MGEAAVVYPTEVDSAPPAPTTAWPPTRPAPARSELIPPLRDNEEIQGNILAGFNKDHQTFLFLSWRSPELARDWLRAVVNRVATNRGVATFNKRFGEQRRNSGSDPESLTAVWTNLSLTADGVELLAPDTIADLKNHENLDAGIQRWLEGAKDATTTGRVGDVNDSAPDRWVFGAAPEPIIHGLLGVAADDMVDLRLELGRQRELAAKHQVMIVWEQAGDTLPQRAKGHEHFGFKDGISQPGVWGFDFQDDGHPGQVRGKPGTDLIEAGTFLIGYPRDDGSAVQAPSWMFDGSFLVTRRLAQDVPGFWNSMVTAHTDITGAARTDPDTGIPSADALAAKLVGRWRSGTPTDTAPVSDRRSSRDSNNGNGNDFDFDFADDLDGGRTPACAPIRKVYPRSGAEPLVSEESSKTRRIVRRGIPFGPPFDPTGGRGRGVDTKRGLLFQCYQSSIEDQFVFLQESWVNADGFPAPQTGKDANIGLTSSVTIRAGGDQHALDFATFVSTEGSVFTFTPAIPTLRFLAEGATLP